MKGKRILMIAFGIVTIHSLGFAQLKKSETDFIYSFCKLVSWPSEYTKGDFEIVVLGNEETAKDLQAQAESQKIGNQNFTIRRIDNLKDLGTPNILFISKAQSSKLNEAKVATEQISTLILTE